MNVEDKEDKPKTQDNFCQNTKSLELINQDDEVTTRKKYSQVLC